MARSRTFCVDWRTSISVCLSLFFWSSVVTGNWFTSIVDVNMLGPEHGNGAEKGNLVIIFTHDSLLSWMSTCWDLNTEIVLRKATWLLSSHMIHFYCGRQHVRTWTRKWCWERQLGYYLHHMHWWYVYVICCIMWSHALVGCTWRRVWYWKVVMITQLHQTD